jgi:ectoine hydroxylase
MINTEMKETTGRGGSATVFDSNCMHGSSDNITPYARWNLFVVFNSTENHVREPYRATSRRPEFVCSRNFAPVRSGRRFMSDA